MKIKVCGMKYEANIRELARLSPDYIGFNFYTRSKRYVGRNFESRVVDSIPKKIKRVGVFVNTSGDYITDKVRRYKLDYIQLHGNESPDFCKRMSEYARIIKAFGVDNNFDFSILEAYKPYCDYFLFDTKTSGYGGSGRTFNWKLLKAYDNKVPYFVSGGIGLEEISNLIRETTNVKPYALDVNSKFEIKPGLKDIDKLKTLKHEVSG